MICNLCKQDREDVQPRKTCKYCNPNKHFYCDECNILIHKGMTPDDELYVRCDYLACRKVATHIDVMNWGVVYNMCDEHFNLVGEYK